MIVRLFRRYGGQWLFNSPLPWGYVVVLKELILTVSNLGGCGGPERTDFNSLYFGGM